MVRYMCLFCNLKDLVNISFPTEFEYRGHLLKAHSKDFVRV